MRVYWTGGSVPPKNHTKHKELRKKFFMEDVQSPEGNLTFWKCAGTSVLERARIFWNRASLDAWATIRLSSKLF